MSEEILKRLLGPSLMIQGLKCDYSREDFYADDGMIYRRSDDELIDILSPYGQGVRRGGES